MKGDCLFVAIFPSLPLDGCFFQSYFSATLVFFLIKTFICIKTHYKVFKAPGLLVLFKYWVTQWSVDIFVGNCADTTLPTHYQRRLPHPVNKSKHPHLSLSKLPQPVLNVDHLELLDWADIKSVIDLHHIVTFCEAYIKKNKPVLHEIFYKVTNNTKTEADIYHGLHFMAAGNTAIKGTCLCSHKNIK